MHFSILAVTAVLLAGVQAKTCINQTVPVTISARQGLFNIAIPSSNLEVVDFILNSTKAGTNFTQLALAGYQTTSGTYNISTQYCTPTEGLTANPAVQVLTHGIGFDKTYWDLSFKNYAYSYLNVATDKYKYATLSFDRLGLGNSSKGEPLNEIQAFLEIAATVELTKMLRAGTFPNVKTAFKKVAHVGHSFGSGQTYSLASMDPTLTDAIVLTGFSLSMAFLPIFSAGGNFQLASVNQPRRFGSVSSEIFEMLIQAYAEPLLELVAPVDFTALPDPQNLPNGYLVSSDAGANKLNFLKPLFYDPEILTLAERTKQPVTLGELLTIGSLPMSNAFAGPVLVITGDSDVPFCGGNCAATSSTLIKSIPEGVKTAFPKVAAGNFTAYIQPNSGHGINLHYNATAAYDVINEFLVVKGVKST